jgi:hypothetical protein
VEQAPQTEISAASVCLCQQLVEVKAAQGLAQPETDQMVALAVELVEMALALEERQHLEKAIMAVIQLQLTQTVVLEVAALEP